MIFESLRRTRICLFTGLTLLLAGLAITGGCSETNDQAKTVTQVAARVNGDEITVHQINNVLEQSQNVSPEMADEAKREILDRLIDQQLAVQQALERKLDRSPKVMQAIEASRREILARAYLEQIAAEAPQRYEWDRNNQEEIRKYYLEHPELFAQRRVFTIEEINLAADNDLVAELDGQIANNLAMQEIADWLKSRDIRFSAKRSVQAAEQLSLKFLPAVQTMTPGEIRLFTLGNNRFQVIRVVSFRGAPVDEATATPRIERFLSNRQSTEMLATELKRIREQAKIEYLGEFANGASREGS